MPDVGTELGTACMLSGHASDRATASGRQNTNTESLKVQKNINMNKRLYKSVFIKNFKDENWSPLAINLNKTFLIN